MEVGFRTYINEEKEYQEGIPFFIDTSGLCT